MNLSGTKRILELVECVEAFGLAAARRLDQYFPKGADVSLLIQAVLGKAESSEGDLCPPWVEP